MILKSMSSMAALNVLRAGASIVVSFFVAKTVAPDSFGLIAFAVPLMNFITILTDLGLASAIVRHPALAREDAGTAVTLLLLAGGAGGLVLAATARPLEHVVGLAGLAPILAGFGLVTTLSIWAAAPRAVLERHYAYRTIATIEFPALIFGLVACGAAIMAHRGIMAIVVYQAAMQIVRASGFLWSARRHYALNLEWGRLSGLASVGGWLLVTNILTYLARNLDNILIGTYLGARTLGIYGLAYQFMTLPLVLFTWPVSGVLLSTLSRLQSDEGAQRDVIRAVLTCTATLTFPMMTALTFAADVPLQLIYSNKWNGLAGIVALLAPVGALQSVAAYCGSVLVQKGKVRLNFLLTIFVSGSMISVFFATVWYGLTTLVISYAALSIVICLANLFFLCRAVHLSAASLLSSLTPGIASSLAGTLAIVAVFGAKPVDLRSWLLCMLVFGGVVFIVTLMSISFIRRSVAVLGRSIAASPAS